MSIKVSIIVSSGTKDLNKKFKYTDKILVIKQYYIDTEDDKMTPRKMEFAWRGTVLKDEKVIKDYSDKISRNKMNIYLTYNLGGGSDVKDDEKITVKTEKFKIGHQIKFRKRNLKYNDEVDSIKTTTTKKCDLYGYNDSINAIMPCGHVFCSEALFDIGYNLFKDDVNVSEINCPLKCSTKWDFDYWAIGACLYDDEYDVFDCEIQRRKAPETKKCPHCFRPNKKPKSVAIYRVACVCSKGDWCWLCGDKWKGGGFAVCGNDDCISNEINITLAKCPSKDLGSGYGNVIVPIYRACIKCNTLIRHNSACKHMVCPKCKHQFCFSCLKSKYAKADSDGNWWPCKSYSYKCPAAPRQKVK